MVEGLTPAAGGLDRDRQNLLELSLTDVVRQTLRPQAILAGPQLRGGGCGRGCGWLKVVPRASGGINEPFAGRLGLRRDDGHAQRITVLS